MNASLLRASLLAAAATATLAFAPAVFAAGSDSGDSNSGESSKTTTECKNGEVYSESKKKCVTADESMNDDELYKAARDFAYAGQYDNALRVMKLAKNQNDPRILNYMGYTNRKLGNVDLAMSYYRKAIAIDGNYLLARSYMGQGMILQGDLEGARLQLVEIRDRGGRDSYAYKALYDALKRGSTY